MSRDFPDWVHPDKAAAARREFSGTVQLKWLDRLSGMIADPGEAEIGFRLVFGHDDQRQVRVEVSVHGTVPLRCQRTLAVFEHALDGCSVVGIVPDDRAAEALPDDYEPLLCHDSRVELLRLIEEEVLLALPLVAVDPRSEQIGAGEETPPDTYRPFAGLAEMKKDRDPDRK